MLVFLTSLTRWSLSGTRVELCVRLVLNLCIVVSRQSAKNKEDTLNRKQIYMGKNLNLFSASYQMSKCKRF